MTRERELASLRTCTAPPPRGSQGSGDHGYTVERVSGPDRSLTFTIISPTGAPLYSFADLRAAESEAATLNGAEPAPSPGKLLSAEIASWLA